MMWQHLLRVVMCYTYDGIRGQSLKNGKINEENGKWVAKSSINKAVDQRRVFGVDRGYFSYEQIFVSRCKK